MTVVNGFALISMCNLKRVFKHAGVVMKQPAPKLLRITLLLGVFELTVCFTPKVYFSKSATDSIDEIVRLGAIPFHRCKDECLKRTRCNSLIYMTQSKLCKLGSKVIGDSDMKTASGSVLVSGFDEYHSTSHVCGSRKCELKETCVQKGPSVHQCEVTECGPPENATYERQLLGNMYSVGNQLIQDGRLGYTITCASSGIWTVVTTNPQRVIIGKQDCLSSGTFTSGVALPATDKPVLCNVNTDGGNWLIFQRRQDGSENFYRGWDDYVKGFGTLTGEFWLGLEELHAIISGGDQFDLRIDMETFDGQKRYAKYSPFTMREKFQLSFLNAGYRWR